jgi:hypothetical protein
MFDLPKSEVRSRQQPIHEDIQFQRYSWLAERLSWVAIVFAIVLAIAGAFGGSGLLLPENSIGADDPMITYVPLARRQAPAELRIETAASRLRFSPNFGDYLDIQSITPPPHGVDQNDGITYSFSSLPSNIRRQIIFSYKPKITGWFDGEISAGAGSGIRFRQFVYP